MTNSPAPHFPLQPVAWSEIARLCRRICLLRECGQPEQAEEVRQRDLQAALDTLAATGAADDFVAQQLETVFAAEAERVANAAALAELLRPLLGADITPLRSDVRSEHKAIVDVPSPFAAAPAPPGRQPAASTGGDIASFIDDMLAQERPRSDASEIRRVS